jgi:hypothetical protein
MTVLMISFRIRTQCASPCPAWNGNYAHQVPAIVKKNRRPGRFGFTKKDFVLPVKDDVISNYGRLSEYLYVRTRGFPAFVYDDG